METCQVERANYTQTGNSIWLQGAIAEKLRGILK